MKNFLFITTIIFSAMSCTNPKTIRIEGNIKGLPDGMIYLTDAYDASKIIDSTKAENGVFVFALTPLANTEPAEVSIRYYKAGLKEILTFDLISHVGLDGKVYGGSGAFILEEGVSKISGDLKGYSTHSLATLFLSDVNIKGGRQTDAYHQTIEFSGVLHDTSKAVMERNATIIKNIPILPGAGLRPVSALLLMF
jgi:Domain of unknown function (DUF4369)